MAALANVVALVAMALAAPALGDDVQAIALQRYEARTIVTGTDMRSRPAGFAACLRDVLVKVSGDPTLADDPGLAALGAKADELVADFDYWDRMSGLPHHDDQGSSDRPFNLTVRFVPERIDAALRSLGRAPWPDPRPVVVPLIRVQSATAAFDLTASEPRAEEMRAALAEAGERYGMVVAIPPPPLPPASAVAPPAMVAVAGSLAFSAAALGWVGTWHADWGGQGYDWSIAGVNFDAAFRLAVSGAMQIVSGHGAPHAPATQ